VQVPPTACRRTTYTCASALADARMSFWHLLATHLVHAHIQMKEGVRLLSGGGRFNLITSDGVEEGIRVLKRFQQVTEFVPFLQLILVSVRLRGIWLFQFRFVHFSALLVCRMPP